MFNGIDRVKLSFNITGSVDVFEYELMTSFGLFSNIAGKVEPTFTIDRLNKVIIAGNVSFSAKVENVVTIKSPPFPFWEISPDTPVTMIITPPNTLSAGKNNYTGAYWDILCTDCYFIGEGTILQTNGDGQASTTGFGIEILGIPFVNEKPRV